MSAAEVGNPPKLVYAKGRQATPFGDFASLTYKQLSQKVCFRNIQDAANTIDTLKESGLTASAMQRESAEVNSRGYGRYYLSNIRCEIGMSEATGKDYIKIVYLVEKASTVSSMK